jgi:hypothetical protein
MRIPIVFIVLLFSNVSNSQTFIDAYNQHQFDNIFTQKAIDSMNASKRKIKKYKRLTAPYLIHLNPQFDTIFLAYKRETGFDFNIADSLTIVYQTNVESKLKSIILFSGSDTISYAETYLIIMHRAKKEIVYTPFINNSTTNGIKIITDRDSLLTLVAKRDFQTAQRLANENPVFDGASSTIIIAKKMNSRYSIEQYNLPPFSFVPILRKE